MVTLAVLRVSLAAIARSLTLFGMTPFQMMRAIYQVAAVSFGSSMVPLNFGGSSSIPKFFE
jgi:hypothetical protein